MNRSRSVSYLIRAALALGACAMMGSGIAAASADASSTASAATPAANTTSATSSDWTQSVQSILLAQATPGPTATAAPAASAAAAPVALEEVTVTGTRIRRPDLQAVSPLVTVTSAQLQQQAGINIESYLNKLPNYSPAQTPTTENEDVQPSAVNTVGISTISLRGLGPNRSLVLIDGHRTVPINALMETDINTIPQAMIQSVQTITGGAAAVYGADAIAGVTNFILKKHFQGAQFDVQDGITQRGDGNQLDVSGVIGSNFADEKGNIVVGLEYYNRQPTLQRNRDFYSSSWSDPNATSTNALNLSIGANGYTPWFGAGPTTAAVNAIFANRAANLPPAATIDAPAFPHAPPGFYAAGPGICSYGSGCGFNNFFFNNDGTVFQNNGPIGRSNYAGPQAGNGFGLVNAYDSTMANSASSAPDEVQHLKWNNPDALVSEPQTRYSFFMNSNYNITENVQFFANARFAQSKTTTLLDVPTTAIYGWEADVPFNATTDSPINPALLNSSTDQATMNQIAAAFAANPTSNAFTNPNYVGPNAAGAQHPVPWQLAMLLLSRGPAGSGGTPPVFGPPGSVATLAGGGPVPCQSQVTIRNSSTPQGQPAVNCPAVSGQAPAPTAPTSWIMAYNPISSAPMRSTVDTSQVWQMETGFNFPLDIKDWTGSLYYSRGQSDDYENAFGTDSLQRYRALIDSPDYGAGQSFQGNANGASVNFGTSVPSNCTSGFYNTIFGGDQTPSADCQLAIGAPLQTMTQMQQDIVDADFNGTLFSLPAGKVSAALGFEYRRVAGQFIPDNLQSTASFLDEAIGLYPLGTLDNEISARDGYAEFFIPLLSNLPFLQKLDLDVADRYSAYSATPNANTFKVSMDAAITRSFRLRGGFNRATRSPNLGELYLGEQEYFGGGAVYGDPCSLYSRAPFGAGAAAPDQSTADIGKPAPTLAGGQTAAGAESTYLICQAQMGSVGAGQYYGPSTSQASGAASAVFAWLNEEGNPNLKSEIADTWTAGFVFDNLGENPWISGLSGSVDWWQIHIDHAIELDSPDYANYLCYGTNIVSTPAAALAQADSPACLNVARNPITGGETTALLQYTNAATIGIAGIDIGLNWVANLEDLGLKHVPGAIGFNMQDSFLDYYRTKQSAASFDVNTNWKDSLGPTLAGTNPGAYGYRLFASLGYILPSFSVNLAWRFLPSVNSAAHAQNAAIIQHNEDVAKTGSGTMLSWTPNTDIAAPAWYAFDLSASWTVTKWLTLRGGIDNLFDKEPAITGATSGFPVGTNLNAVCSPSQTALGCINPTAYSLPNDGGGLTNTGFYDLYGREFFLGFRATF